LTPDLAFRCGAACGYLFKKDNNNCKVIIGSDTRASKDMLMGALISGFTYSGCNVEHIGVLPTPALAFLIDRMGATAGVMISASHNPYYYNGLKILAKGGIKLPDEKEAEVEALMDPFEIAPAEKPGNLSYNLKAKDFYCEHIKQACEEELSTYKVILDCSNGATSDTAHRVFGELGVDARIYHDKPNGININEGCGSMHMEELASIVQRKGADIGFAFDGDADRCLACDSRGRIIDGDKILAVLALYLKERGRLKKDTLVATVMSNLGLIEKMKQNGIQVPTTKVGDRYVLEEMMEQDYVLGGESSGHIIFLEKATTGDGQLTAIMLLCAMKALKMTSEEVFDIFTPYPQLQINVTADDLQKRKLMKDDTFLKNVAKAEAAFAGHGRILVRPSGTEPYIRILVEGPDAALVEQTANALKESTDIRLSQLF
ncbi:MAG: phosphoglucosamine mutase, partial [Clostridia bacterium]|nr:phosphoglucosamine mutase [Clostridia bacterium]